MFCVLNNLHLFKLRACQREVGFYVAGHLFPFLVITIRRMTVRTIPLSHVEAVTVGLHLVILVGVCLIEQIHQIVDHVGFDLEESGRLDQEVCQRTSTHLL